MEHLNPTRNEDASCLDPWIRRSEIRPCDPTQSQSPTLSGNETSWQALLSASFKQKHTHTHRHSTCLQTCAALEPTSAPFIRQPRSRMDWFGDFSPFLERTKFRETKALRWPQGPMKITAQVSLEKALQIGTQDRANSCLPLCAMHRFEPPACDSTPVNGTAQLRPFLVPQAL